MKFPERVAVSLVLRKTDEETIGEDVWLTYALEGAAGTQINFHIEVGAFNEEDLKQLEVALAEDLAEAIVKTVRDAQSQIEGTN